MRTKHFRNSAFCDDTAEASEVNQQIDSFGELTEAVFVRLEGGIGDHLLGMRVLPFVRKRFPKRRIVVLSDAGGSPAQSAIAGMSAEVDAVISVSHRTQPESIEAMGHLEQLDDQAQVFIREAHCFIDAWGNSWMLDAARTLNAPIFDILSAVPKLEIPASDSAAARKLLPSGKRIFVGLNLSKFGLILAPQHWEVVSRFIAELLGDSRVTILNFFASRFDFTHWPKALQEQRARLLSMESEFLRKLQDQHPRILSIENLPITTVAALLAECAYFIGVDNGIKHLAWALDVPRTFFLSDVPDGLFILRWMPDFHRLLLFSESKEKQDIHLQEAKIRISEVANLQ